MDTNSTPTAAPADCDEPQPEPQPKCCETCINGLPGSGVMVECLVDRIWKHFDHVCKLYEREFSR